MVGTSEEQKDWCAWIPVSEGGNGMRWGCTNGVLTAILMMLDFITSVISDLTTMGKGRRGKIFMYD